MNGQLPVTTVVKVFSFILREGFCTNLNLNTMCMLQKYTVLALLGIIATSNGYPLALQKHEQPPEYKSSDYSFSYGVKDLHTGDVKHQWEKKDGDKITGHYSVLEPDGTVRLVDYTADDKSGFNAVVKHKGTAYHLIDDKKPSSHSEVSIKSTIKEKTEVEYAPEDEGKHHVQALVLKEELPEESQPEAVRSAITLNGPVYITRPKDYSSMKPLTYYHPSVLPNLPLDLNLIKQYTGDKIIPVDVSVVNPIEIDLSESSSQHKDVTYSTKDQSMKPSHQISQQQVNKFLVEFFNSGLNKLNEPQMEHGFKPMVKKYNNVIIQPILPQPFKANKKVVTSHGGRVSHPKTPNNHGAAGAKGRNIQQRRNYNLPPKSNIVYGQRVDVGVGGPQSQVYRTGSGTVRHKRSVTFD